MRDLLFEPASLDEWVQGGRRWDDPPPDITPASQFAVPAPPVFLPAGRPACMPARPPTTCQHTAPPFAPPLPPRLLACPAHPLPGPCRCPAAPSTRYAGHAGILEAARATFIDLQEHGVLHRTLLAPDGRCHGWRLVVTGHSLGAGCAFLLALYLRQFCPELR